MFTIHRQQSILRKEYSDRVQHLKEEIVFSEKLNRSVRGRDNCSSEEFVIPQSNNDSNQSYYYEEEFEFLK